MALFAGWMVFYENNRKLKNTRNEVSEFSAAGFPDPLTQETASSTNYRPVEMDSK